MKREFYKVHVPKERVLTRDYWELLQVSPEHRVEFTNKYFYKDVIIKASDRDKQMRKLLKLHREGWKLYEMVNLESVDEVFVYRTMRVISFAITVEPLQGSEVVEIALYSFIGKRDREVKEKETGFPNRSYDHGLPEGILYENWDKDSTLAGKGGADLDDYNLINVMLKVNDKRVRDRVKGKKVYDEWDLLGKERCSVGAFSFINKHCTQAVYRDGLCYYHWMQTQDKRSGCNPALPDESFHTLKKPYIPSIDEDAIFAKMKQYHEASKPITPAAETPKKPRCKHLLHRNECSICLKRPSVAPDSIDGLPEEVDSFMIFHYQ